MVDPSQYQLLDCGAGRKLESFAGYVVDRPAPAAEAIGRKDPDRWRRAAARYERGERQQGAWSPRQSPPVDWQFACGAVRLELRLSEFGQVGLFPEQAENWRWIGEQVRKAERPLDVLNLFAYTGGSTLAAAAAGAAVVHVDAARSTMSWARSNADLSGLAGTAIRWITEDARLFVRRELKRARRYDAVILDPPSYGHGPAGQVWQFAEHIEELLAACGELTAGQPRFMLFSCHSPGVGPREAAQLLASALPAGAAKQIEAAELVLSTAGGERLDCGVCGRWSASGY